jgi:hypothetical protein
MLSIVKASTDELAKFLGVAIGESVLVIPVNQIPSGKSISTQSAQANASADLSNPNLHLTNYGNLTSNERLIVNALKVLGKSGRGEVMDRTRLTPAAWTTAINTLKESTLVTQTGDRRSAQYYLTETETKTTSQSEIKKNASAEAMIAELEQSISNEPESSKFGSSKSEPESESSKSETPASPKEKLGMPKLSSSDVDEEVEEVPDPDAPVISELLGMAEGEVNW